MKWIVENWSFLAVVAIMIFLAVKYIQHFVNLPSDEQLAKVKQWALYIVIEIEKQYGSGTGVLKLRAAYDAFVKAFPDLVAFVSFEMFSKIIDEALVRMKELLTTNLDIRAYVEGDTEVKE